MHHSDRFEDVEIGWDVFAAFYSDHFGISVVIRKEKDSFRQIQTTVPDYLLLEPNSSSNATPKATEKEKTTKKNDLKKKGPRSSPDKKRKRR